MISMAFPSAPGVQGVEESGHNVGHKKGAGFFNDLFDFYGSISTEHNTRRFPGNELQKEMQSKRLWWA